MDPEAFTGCPQLFKWDPRVVVATAASTPPPPHQMQQQHHQQQDMRQRELEEVLGAYGIRYVTAAKIAELGFTVNTLVDMKEEEVDEMMNSLCHIFRWELLVGERYGIKAAIRAHKRRLGLLPPTVEDFHDYNSSCTRRRLLHPPSDTNALDTLSQEGLSEEPVQQEKDGVGTGSGEANYQRRKHRRRRKGGVVDMDGDNQQIDDEEDHDVDDGQDDDEEGDLRRQREHPFIVTEPGEVARGKKNGLDYLFHLYEQCREFLIQVQNIAKERGEKCPTKVTNQVFRFAKKAGASYINKPKMRHYVHCYALHCLDEEASNAIRKAFKERGENVGAWRQACYRPLVAIAARRANWDIDAIFNAHPRLSIWYVPTKLRQLCHAERSSSTSVSPSPPVATPTIDHHLPLHSSPY